MFLSQINNSHLKNGSMNSEKVILHGTKAMEILAKLLMFLTKALSPNKYIYIYMFSVMCILCAINCAQRQKRQWICQKSRLYVYILSSFFIRKSTVGGWKVAVLLFYFSFVYLANVYPPRKLIQEKHV